MDNLRAINEGIENNAINKIIPKLFTNITTLNDISIYDSKVIKLVFKFKVLAYSSSNILIFISSPKNKKNNKTNINKPKLIRLSIGLTNKIFPNK